MAPSAFGTSLFQRIEAIESVSPMRTFERWFLTYSMVSASVTQ